MITKQENKNTCNSDIDSQGFLGTSTSTGPAAAAAAAAPAASRKLEAPTSKVFSRGLNVLWSERTKNANQAGKTKTNRNVRGGVAVGVGGEVGRS